MREVVIALGLIRQGDNFLLQLRGDNPMIGGAGLIGCFGGKIENGETPVEAITREIAEETSHHPSVKEFAQLGTIEVISDHKMETVSVKGFVFELVLDANTSFDATEGTLITLPYKKIGETLDKMTTGTRACFEQFIMKGK